MKNLYYILFLSLVMALGSCSKDEVNTSEYNSNSYLEKLIDIDGVLDTESDISTDYDAVIFFTGHAIATLASNDSDIKDIIYNYSQNSSITKISEICETFPEFRNQLNNEISKSLGETDVYSDFKKSHFSQDIIDDTGFDYINFFENIISKVRRKEVLTLYVPEPLQGAVGEKNFYLGFDVGTTDKDKALVFNGDSFFLLSEDAAQKVQEQVIFIGVAKSSTPEKFNNWFEHKLSKWYHHGRATLNSSNDQIEVSWITKYRWYSGWKLKEIVPLNSQGASDEYYYWGYRITCRVDYTTSQSPSVLVEQKHWDASPWEDVYELN